MADETFRGSAFGTGFDVRSLNVNPLAAERFPVAFDLGAAAAPAFTRGGIEVPPVAVDAVNFDWFFVPLPQQQPRVVASTPAAGTAVLRGSQVDLILAPREEVVFDLFQDVHGGFSGRTVTDPVMADADVRSIVQRYRDASTVPQAERDLLTARLQANGITINEADPRLTFARAFQTLRNAEAFR
jgi:hypothetical protein